MRQLQSYRRPASGSGSRHVPVRAFSYTIGAYLALESGLEHDLLRRLDRDPSVTWLVSQPFALGWDVAARRTRKSHVPDLISLASDGAVTVWDVKSPEGAASSKFAEVREVSRQACEERGWGYEVFTGLGPTHRHNLLWLHAYRRRQPWVDHYEDDLIAACDGGAKLGDLVRARRSHEYLAAIWHLIWAGHLKVDLAQRLTGASEVTT
ncbi:TnsA-like heteromeric transposase endonuclease subunit [Nocardioides rotundus]|nr:TnsA-like heteromeric transposase endonuclease subunit [Nocardioides rotundus]